MTSPHPSQLLTRFTGAGGLGRLLEALKSQSLVQGNDNLALELADASKLSFALAGERLIDQASADSDILFILAGETRVEANGRLVAIRKAGTHIGEMAMIDPGALRCADVIAVTDVVVARVPEAAFTQIADRFPRAWRLLAVELSQRLRQRNTRLTKPNQMPIVFIGSSSEALPISQALRKGLELHPVEVRVWSDPGIFTPGHYTAEDLLRQVAQADFAVVALAPDDRVFSRFRLFTAPRDNVLCEVSLFMGALGRERALMLQPQSKNFKIPTDFLGLNTIRYKTPRNKDWDVALETICNQLGKLIVGLGPK
jgi:CRP/FNR family cyclic AMP-dependent transcriptional regulator